MPFWLFVLFATTGALCRTLGPRSSVAGLVWAPSTLLHPLWPGPGPASPARTVQPHLRPFGPHMAIAGPRWGPLSPRLAFLDHTGLSGLVLVPVAPCRPLRPRCGRGSPIGPLPGKLRFGPLSRVEVGRCDLRLATAPRSGLFGPRLVLRALWACYAPFWWMQPHFGLAGLGVRG